MKSSLWDRRFPHSFSTSVALSFFIFIIFSSSIVSFYNPSSVLAQEQEQQAQLLQSAKDTFSTLNEKGSDLLYNQGNYTEAIKYFDKVLAIDPNNADAIYYKGAALDNLGKHTEGISFVNKAIMLSDKVLSIDPYNVDLLAIKGRAFNRLQNYTEAIKYFDKALAIDPTYKYALANKGVALNKLGNYSEAIRYYDKALDIDPKFVYALSGKGDTLSNQGNYTEARKYYEKALSISPNYVSILINIGNIFYNQGNYTEARKYSDKVLAISSSSLSSPINQNKDQQSLIGSNNHALAEYTFMVYMVGSDLEAKSYAATQNIRQMENIGSTSNVNIIVETGGGNDQTMIDDKRFIDFTKVQRHKILHNNIQTLVDLGHQQNMGDPHTLSDFIAWGVSNLPAKRYAIILWDHGSGINGFGGDLQFNNDKLTIDEIHQAFADTTNLTNSTRGFELIGFDSCLMASIEVANSIEPFGNYMVSSEEIEPQWGWDYSFILRSLVTYPNQNGLSLGKLIADSFFGQSNSISAAQGYSAQREITLSIINLSKVPELVRNLEYLADYIGNNLTDFNHVISFIKSVDSAGRYGQTFKGSSGLVDIYDLTSNIKERFPQSEKLVDTVQKSLINTVVYKKNGDANPNANGLSIYMPIKEEEFTDARKYTLPSWQRIVNLQYNMIKHDHAGPPIQSNLTADTIRGHIYANDVASVTLWIYTTSMPEGNTAIYQDLDPSSFIKSDGSFEYKWDKQILSLCNSKKTDQQQVCKPSLMKLEVNKDKKFALIPIRLKSNVDDVDEEVSLKYEINNENNFTLLGARPETEKFCEQFSQELCKQLLQQTVPKENWPLRPNDIVYPLVYTFSSEDDNINDLLFVEYPYMQVGENLNPRYTYYDGNYDILFRVCDYSNNCLTTRWFHFNDTAQAQPEIIDLGEHNIPVCKEGTILKNFSIYRNPLYELNIQYPSNWKKIENAYTDDFIVGFQAPSFDEDGYPSAQILINAGYWPGTYKEFIDDNTPSTMYDPFLKIISINSTNLGGYPAYEQVTSKGSIQTMDIDALIGHTWYTVTYTSDPSKFSSYLPYVKKLIDSFQLCRGTELIKPTQNGNITYEVNNNSREARQFTNSTDNISNFSTYTNPFFKIRYPSDWKIEDNKQRNVILHSPVAIMSNSSSSWYRTESIVKFSITEVGNASLLYERGVSLEGFANILLSDTRESSTGFNLYESKPIILNGNQAYKITYSYFDSNYKTAWKDTTIITIINDKVYFLEYDGDSSRYEYYLPILQNMLDSFEAIFSQPAAR